jgi:hypothetical protein
MCLNPGHILQEERYERNIDKKIVLIDYCRETALPCPNFG